MSLDPSNPFVLIPTALAQSPDLVVALPVYSPSAPDMTLVLGAKRHLKRLPPALALQMAQQEAQDKGNGSGPVKPPTHLEIGRLLLTVPVDMALNLRGPESERHPVFLISVHRSVYDEAVRQQRSGIVLPGVGMTNPGSRIVKP